MQAIKKNRIKLSHYHSVINATAVIIFFLFITACGENNSRQDANAITESSHSNPDSIKSGIIYMKSTTPIGGSDVEKIIYFDNYGAQKRTETIARMKVNDQEISNTHIVIDADGYSNTFDPETKLGRKTRISKTFNPTQINFANIDKQTMQLFGIRKEGVETVAGKNCDIYTIEYPTMDNFKGRYSVWNNIPLHETSSTSEFGYEYIATKVDENVDIQPIMFLVPDSIQLTETIAGSDSLKYKMMNDSLARKLKK
jgi:hypothetical protein